MARRENLSLGGPTAGHSPMYFVGITPLSTNMGYIHQHLHICARMEFIKSRFHRPRRAKPSLAAKSCYSRCLIELALTFAKSYSQFMIKIHSGRPRHGVKFAKIFGNNAWPLLILSFVTWPSTRPDIYCFPRIGLAHKPLHVNQSLFSSTSSLLKE